MGSSSGTQPASGWSPAAARRLGGLLHLIGLVGLALLLGVALRPLQQPVGWVGAALVALDVVGHLALLRRLPQPTGSPEAWPGG